MHCSLYVDLLKLSVEKSEKSASLTKLSLNINYFCTDLSHRVKKK
jgi:hypothetical protein